MRGQVAQPPDSNNETGVLRKMTELVLAVCEVCLFDWSILHRSLSESKQELLPSLSQLILDPFAAHVILSLFILLSPQIVQRSDSQNASRSVRSKKSAAYKSRQGSMKSILSSNEQWVVPETPASFKDVATRFVDTLRNTTDANEIRALAINKVASPVLQVNSYFLQ